MPLNLHYKCNQHLETHTSYTAFPSRSDGAGFTLNYKSGIAAWA